MATLQTLKKKLRGIKSTEKLTKAMKTVSAAKYSRLNRSFSDYNGFAERCYSLYKKYEDEINALLPECDPAAPTAVFVMSSNKGMCGGFNSEIFSFFNNEKKSFPKNTLYFPCGKKAISYFTEKKIPFEKSFVFSDIPTAEESNAFLEEILLLRKEKKISKVNVIYPRYKNVMKQIPEMTELFTGETKKNENEEENILFIPDKKTVMKAICDKVLSVSVYRIILETALGSQGATLTTMRSAYDTAVAYSSMLETQINRKRQSEVTADVLETAVER